MLRRINKETDASLSLNGNCPLPPFTWQPWQVLVLNKGPKPSRAGVVDGAATQGC